MSLLQSGATKSLAASYDIDNSLRLNNGDSAHLIRTMGTPTNNKKWTLSTWFKMGDFSQGQLLSAGGNQVFVLGTGQFEFAGAASGTLERMKTTQLFRDPGAWYHIVFSMDTTQAAFADQMKLYVNGAQVTAFDISTAVTQDINTEINSAIAHSVGRYSGGSEYWDGYLAEYYFVDGSVLDADDFGELSSTTNQWIPLDSDDVKDAVTFGANGFYQKYNSTELATSFEDSSSGIFQGSDFSAVTTTMSIGTGTIGLIIDGTTTASSGCIPTGSQTVSAQNVTFDCGSGVTKIFTYAEFILSNTYDDGDWKWQGSNDNVSYSDIGSGNFTIQGSTAEGPPIDITAGLSSNTTAYRYYRWQGVSGTTTASNFWTEIVNLRTAPPGTGFHTITAVADATNQRPQHHDLTANGHAHLIGPKVGTSVIHFAGGGQYLSMPDSSDWQLGGGTGDFTVECWMNPLTPATEFKYFGQRADDNNRWYLSLYLEKVIFFSNNAGTGSGYYTETTAGSIKANTWSHVAFVRSGSTAYLFVNGVSQPLTEDTAFGTMVDASAVMCVGRFDTTSDTQDFVGSMGPVRISNSARYTADFDVPTTVWTNDGNTKLLIQNGTDGSQTFDDLSTGDHTITANGSVRWFAPKVGAGAMAFDGTGDYYTIPDNYNWTLFDVGAATWEGWFKLTDYSTAACLFSQYADSNNKWQISHNGAGSGSNGLEVGMKLSGTWYESGYAGSSAGGITDRDWHHIAVVRVDNGANRTFTIYLDGTALDNTFTTDRTNDFSSSLFIGNNGAGGSEVNGYMDMVRVSQTARYTASFSGSLPTTIFTPDVYTSLLLNADINQGIWNQDTSTGLAISSDSRMSFNGSDQYLTIPDSSDWDFPGDFTIEMWFYTDDINQQGMFWSHKDYGGGTDGTGQCQMYLYNDNKVYWDVSSSGTYETTSFSSTPITKNAWHHIAFVRDFGSWYKIFLDGVLQVTNTTDVSLDISGEQTTVSIGKYNNYAGSYLDGYLDEIRVSKGVARYSANFTPQTTPFEADANTVLLIHSDYTGGLGADSSGNYNNFTATNLVATDQMIDTPTNNFCTLNPIVFVPGSGGLPYDGNLSFTRGADDAWGTIASTMAPESGKWYFEGLLVSTSGTTNTGIGLAGTNALDVWRGSTNGNGDTPVVKYTNDGTVSMDGEAISPNPYGATYVAGDIISVAYDMDASPRTCTYYKNNTIVNAAFDLSSAFTTTTGIAPLLFMWGREKWTMNFGQDSSFSGEETAQGNQDSKSKGDFYYEPPTDYLALCSDNLPSPDIALPGENFNTVLWTGNSSTQTVTSSLDFQPDFLWTKVYSNADSHILRDVVRDGSTTMVESIRSNSAAAEYTSSGSLTTSSNGFSVSGHDGGEFNYDTYNYVTWNWKAGGVPTADNSAGAGAVPTAGSVKIDGSNLGSALAGSLAAIRISANTTAGFSIVRYTGTGSETTVGHGLSSAPELVIIKNLTSAGTAWQTGSARLTSWSYHVALNETAAETSSDTFFGGDAPTASVFTIGTAGDVNTDTSRYISYCFHSVEGYSKVGVYTGNGDANGTFVYTGFKPKFVIVKNSNLADDWEIYDGTMNPYNYLDLGLKPNTTGAEYALNSANRAWDFVSNGFKVRGTNGGINQNNDELIFLAVAESPFSTSNAR